MIGIRNRRREPWHAILGRTAIAAALPLALEAAVVSTAEAADLPAQLLAAAKAIPADAGGRRICLSINGLTNAFGMPPVLGDQRVSAGSATYAAATVGAYLGDGPAGAPASPFAQALLDVGAAARLRVIWTQHTRVPTLRTPQLQDLGTAASGGGTAPQPAFVERDATSEGDVYLVTGPDRQLFAHDADFLVPRPPPLANASADPASQGPGAGSPPPGIWSTSHLCYALVPDRVLEYGDVVDHGNGVSEVTALILFRPDRMPAWVTDQRVIQALQPPMKPLDVRGVVFRNDGDGWRAQPSQAPMLPGKTHILAEDGR